MPTPGHALLGPGSSNSADHSSFDDAAAAAVPPSAAVDVTLLGRFYERFADHCVVDIGRRVVFQITESTDTAG